MDDKLFPMEYDVRQEQTLANTFGAPVYYIDPFPPSPNPRTRRPVTTITAVVGKVVSYTPPNDTTGSAGRYTISYTFDDKPMTHVMPGNANNVRSLGLGDGTRDVGKRVELILGDGKVREIMPVPGPKQPASIEVVVGTVLEYVPGPRSMATGELLTPYAGKYRVSYVHNGKVRIHDLLTELEDLGLVNREMDVGKKVELVVDGFTGLVKNVGPMPTVGVPSKTGAATSKSIASPAPAFKAIKGPYIVEATVAKYVSTKMPGSSGRYTIKYIPRDGKAKMFDYSGSEKDLAELGLGEKAKDVGKKVALFVNGETEQAMRLLPVTALKDKGAVKTCTEFLGDGPIQSDAQAQGGECASVCNRMRPGSKFTGEWKTIVEGSKSVCECGYAPGSSGRCDPPKKLFTLPTPKPAPAAVKPAAKPAPKPAAKPAPAAVVVVPTPIVFPLWTTSFFVKAGAMAAFVLIAVLIARGDFRTSAVGVALFGAYVAATVLVNRKCLRQSPTTAWCKAYEILG